MNTTKLPEKIAEFAAINNVPDAEIARVIAVHKERYVVQNDNAVFKAEITGNIRYTAQSSADFPTVGDWVRFTKMDDENAIILELFPRFSLLERQAVGKHGEIQLIASNVDVAFIVQSVGHDFNLNRLERYLAACNAGNINAVMVLSKTDLIPESECKELISEVNKRIKNIKTIALSNESEQGLDLLRNELKSYKTYCFLGSSGVGKSTIINHLLNREIMETQSISESTNKGRHTTSHRELFVLENKSVVIDTPGMRELGITDSSEALEVTFDDISELAQDCKFSDCTHNNEAGCAVIEAVESGELSEEAYENYMKLKREQEHFSSTVYEKRQRDKEFGKMIKSVLKEKKQSKPR
ncbi:ribosome small subunit-dependent GTPase A [Draconibacterium sp. IB214405]|uniref:ribosome small subunit-dependent GTPase A n=1 Tax=Draconibacterium sp. IB214405 TaxID=3097352 RepID=UPI002A14BB97|nr:ribosome small subunit-dependent GTPase A [Draconibacterium sp. IB214405]MDX8339694.1 ribosome small subunit-dependent GTPase A [Draconibacterium sp. IB214405]